MCVFKFGHHIKKQHLQGISVLLPFHVSLPLSGGCPCLRIRSVPHPFLGCWCPCACLAHGRDQPCVHWLNRGIMAIGTQDPDMCSEGEPRALPRRKDSGDQWRPHWWEWVQGPHAGWVPGSPSPDPECAVSSTPRACECRGQGYPGHRWGNWDSDRFTSLLKACCSLVAQLCLTLWDRMDCSLPGFSVHGISQAKIVGCQPRDRTDRTRVSCIGGRIFFFNHWASREALLKVTQGGKEEVRLPLQIPCSSCQLCSRNGIEW